MFYGLWIYVLLFFLLLIVGFAIWAFTEFSNFKSQFQLYYHQVKGIKTILEKQHGITK